MLLYWNEKEGERERERERRQFLEHGCERHICFEDRVETWQGEGGQRPIHSPGSPFFQFDAQNSSEVVVIMQEKAKSAND